MEKKNDVISIIVPCHNEQEVLPFFLEEVEKVYNEITEGCRALLEKIHTA